MSTDQQTRKLPSALLQEYLEDISTVSEAAPQKRQQKMLFSYAELQFKLHGGSKCAMCNAHVRHVVPVRVERTSGGVAEFACLCMRCLEAERVTSRQVIMELGNVKVRYGNSSRRRTTVSFSADDVKAATQGK